MAYLDALQKRDFQRIETYFDPRVAFRALVPADLHVETDALQTIARLREWFGDADEITIARQVIEDTLGSLYLAYRVHLRQDDEWQVVEQHAYCAVRDGRIERMDLLCSGFRTTPAPGSTVEWSGLETETPGSPSATGTSAPRSDSLLDALGQGCATLTPLIRARIREMESGRVLEVRTDDPTAEDNLQAWSRLTGNELVAVVAEGADTQRFFIRKK
jgi:TusA-related sulfurtransferase